MKTDGMYVFKKQVLYMVEQKTEEYKSNHFGISRGKFSDFSFKIFVGPTTITVHYTIIIL